MTYEKKNTTTYALGGVWRAHFREAPRSNFCDGLSIYMILSQIPWIESLTMKKRVFIVGYSTPRSVSPSFCLSHFYFAALMGVLALLLLPKCSTDLNYGPCPPARDWGSRVSGLVVVRT